MADGSIWKEGKYWMARTSKGRKVHLGTVDRIVFILESWRGKNLEV